MYRSKNRHQLEFPDFYLPFSGHLDTENRWIRLAKLVPWALAEEIYHAELSEDSGAPIVPARVALGALLIKERLGLTDRETVEAIQENPYLQFFIGYEEFSQDRPFDASLMVDFRKRYGAEGLQRIGEAIAVSALEETEPTSETSTSETPTDETPTDETPADDVSQPTLAPPRPAGEHTEETHGQEALPENAPSDGTTELPANRGRLIADATCAPADVRYPTDVSLLNEAREKTEDIIDELHLPLVGKSPRPRTYRVKARRAFVALAKKKQPRRRVIRRAQKQQLGYLRRNLKAIDRLLACPQALPLARLSRQLYKNLLVCREVYRQQLEMFENNARRVDDRIVSVSQPHVRPIKRGKAGRETEFGAKLSLSVVGGFSFVDRLSWDNYNESLDLAPQIERYRRRFGFYPESVHADKIYRTRANRAFCKQHGIRLSGPPLGRPPQHVSAADKKQSRTDEAIRNRVEGKFGQGKRRFGLGRVMAKLASTSAAQISLTFLVMNLEEALRRFFLAIVFLCHGAAGLIRAASGCFDRRFALMRRPRPRHAIRPRLAIESQKITRWALAD